MEKKINNWQCDWPSTDNSISCYFNNDKNE